MPDKTPRFSLALILLFIAPSAWGQLQNGPEPKDGDHCIVHSGGKVIACSGPMIYDGHWLINSAGTFTPPPSCDPGWELVMRLNSGGTPLCAWVLKEPIYK